MADKKDGSDVELKVEKKGAERKPWTVKRIATTVIIFILALLMVGGSFYYIFAPGFSENSNAFGYYDGQIIKYEANNTFGRTLQSDQEYMNAYMSGDYNKIWQSWYQAYQTQVMFVAINQQAKKMDIPAPTSLVNKMILSSGVYNNENGEFDEAKYNEALPADKQNFFEYVKDLFPYQKVLSDIALTVPSKNESAFIDELNKKGRDFSYFTVDYAVYPSYKAEFYAKDNAELFNSLNLSILSCNSEEKIKNAYDALKAGQSWNDAVKEYSEDNYVSNNGSLGSELYASIIQSNMKNPEEISKIFALNVGEYTQPIQGPYSYSIYKLDSAVKAADFSDPAVLDYVKSYIFAKNPEEVKPYIANALASATDVAFKDFEKAAKNYSSGIVKVVGANDNFGGSQFLVGMQYSDPKAELAYAVTEDEDLAKKLFTGNVGDIIGPIEKENSTMFVRIDSTDSATVMGEMMKQYYDYYNNQLLLVDLRNAIINSDKHKDMFTQRFFDMFLSNQTQNQTETSEAKS